MESRGAERRGERGEEQRGADLIREKPSREEMRGTERGGVEWNGEGRRGAERIQEEPRGAERRGEDPIGEERCGEEMRGERRSRAAEVIKAKGDNNFLDMDGTPHVGVRADFKENDTRSGLTRKDGCVFL